MLFNHSSQFPFPVERLFGYHEQAGAIDRLIPPWERTFVLESKDSLHVGSIVKIKNKVGPFSQNLVAEHTEYRPNELFVDEMRSGPFSRWKHQHLFEAISDVSSRLTDRIEVGLPLAPLGNILSGWVQAKLESMFRFRHRITLDDLQFSDQLSQLGHKPAEKPVKIGISGSSGLIGRRTIELARVLGIEVIRSVRSESKQQQVRWPRGVKTVQEECIEEIEGLDAWIHLGGVGIADRRWNEQYKRAIRDSRIESTRRIVERLSKLERPPRAFVCASGVGIYADRQDEFLDESSSVDPSVTKDDFLAEVARQWESTARNYESFGRVVLARFGIVLHPRSGALSKMLLPFRMGIGGPVGSGKQYWPWVHVDDAASILLFLALNPQCSGPMNVVAPECLPNRDFSRVLARVLHRPSWISTPAFALRLGLGQMADPLLLSSARAIPSGLLSAGYKFRFPTLDAALDNLLGCRRPSN
ncbi:MAG: TIGR01777 family oxidoreductase [Planctomycetota bacterium]